MFDISKRIWRRNKRTKGKKENERSRVTMLIRFLPLSSYFFPSLFLVRLFLFFPRGTRLSLCERKRDTPSMISFLSGAMLSRTREISNARNGNRPEMNAPRNVSLSSGYARGFPDGWNFVLRKFHAKTEPLLVMVARNSASIELAAASRLWKIVLRKMNRNRSSSIITMSICRNISEC